MDKVQIYQELERRGELGRLPPEKQAIWAEYKRRQEAPVASVGELKKGLTPWQRVGQGLKHDLEDIGYGMKKALSGATLGASDWALRKLGVTDDDYLAEREAEGLGNYVKGAGFVSELGGNMLGAGGALAKSLGKAGLKGLKLASASGGLEGAAYGLTGSDSWSEVPQNVAIGAGFGAAAPVGMAGAGYAGSKLVTPFSSRLMTAGMKGGLNNVVENPEAVKLLNQGIKQSDDVASEFLLKSRPVARGINKDTANMVDSALTSRVDIPKAIRSANEKYGKYMDEHGADQIYSMLSPEEQKAANFAKFFEGSKVVDENGQPLKLYHGTDADFDAFDMSKGRSTMDIQGAFFSPYDIDAKGYGQNLKEVYLNVKNPADEATAYKALRKYQGQNDAGLKAKQDLQRQGFDGVFNGYDEYIAFEPNQIKSVNNSGAWSSSPSLSDAGWTPEPYIGSLYEGLNPFQAKSLKGAIVRGGEKLEKGAKLGSVDHFNKIKQDINSQISDLVVRKGKEGDVRLLEILKRSVDNKAPKELKVVDKIYEKAKRLQDAFDRGKHYNPNNVEGADYISELSPLEQNAFAQGVFKRINNNSLTGKNLANTALGYENTLASVLRGDKYDDLMKGLNKQSTKFERLAGLGRKAETKLNTPEAQRFFGREQLESRGSLIGSGLDWANNLLRGRAIRNASNNLMNPDFVGAPVESWVVRNPTLSAGLSAEAVKNYNNW